MLTQELIAELFSMLDALPGMVPYGSLPSGIDIIKRRLQSEYSLGQVVMSARDPVATTVATPAKPEPVEPAGDLGWEDMMEEQLHQLHQRMLSLIARVVRLEERTGFPSTAPTTPP